MNGIISPRLGEHKCCPLGAQVLFRRHLAGEGKKQNWECVCVWEGVNHLNGPQQQLPSLPIKSLPILWQVR